MAPVVIPVAVAAASAGVGVAIGVTTVMAAAVSVGATAAAAGAGYLLAPNDKSLTVADTRAEGPPAAPVNGQRMVVAREPLPPRRIVYGSTRVGGVLIFQDNNNPFLYLLIAVSDGEIEAFDDLYIGEQLVPLVSGVPQSSSMFAGRLYAEFREGTTIQPASPTLLAAFPSDLTSAFRQRGVATALVRLDWGADATQHNALWGNSLAPSMQVRGARVVDPRLSGTNPNASTSRVYSSNPALCLAHALTNAWDLALDYADVDWTSVLEAANDCDAGTTYQSQSVLFFTMAGVFQSGHEMASQVAGMLSAFGGALYFHDGKYRIRADKARSPVWTIGDDDIIEINEFVHEGEASAVPNAIKAQFANATGEGVDAFTPLYTHPGTSGEPRRELVLRLPYTGRSHSAQILAYRELIRARDGRQLTLTTSDAGLWLEPLDVVEITSASAPWLNGLYQAVQIDMAPVGAALVLRGYAADAYANPTSYFQ